MRYMLIISLFFMAPSIFSADLIVPADLVINELLQFIEHKNKIEQEDRRALFVHEVDIDQKLISLTDIVGYLVTPEQKAPKPKARL